MSKKNREKSRRDRREREAANSSTDRPASLGIAMSDHTLIALGMGLVTPAQVFGRHSDTCSCRHCVSLMAPGQESMACAVCTETLGVQARLDGTIHGHAHVEDGHPVDVDHPAVPVPASQVRRARKCDFCSAPNADWELPCADFVVSPEHTADQSFGAWAACEACATHLAGDDWGGLLERCVAILSPGTIARGRTLAWHREFVTGVHQRVRHFATGPVARVNEAGAR